MLKTFQASSLYILVLTILFYCLDYYFRISPSLIIPELMHQYQITALGIGAFASAFYVGYLLLQIPIGFLLDNSSLKKILLISIGACISSFILFLYCHNFAAGYALRFLTGAFSAFSFISVLYIAQYNFPANTFNLIAGITISIGTVSAALADILTSHLSQHVSWQTIMATMALLGIVIMLMLVVPQNYLIKAPVQKNQSSTSILQDVKTLLNTKNFILNSIVGGLMYTPTSLIAAVWGITFMNIHYHMDKVAASNGVLYLFIGWAIGSPIMGYLGDRLRYSVRLLIIGALLSFITSIFYVYGYSISQWQVYTLLFTFGFFSSTQVVIWKLFSRLCPLELSGLGIASTNMLITLTGAIMHFLIGTLLSNEKQYTETNYFVFSHALWLIPACLLLAAGLSFILANRLAVERCWSS